MNNVKYYNDSLAYDFEMFMPRPAEKTRERDNIVSMPKERSAARRRQRSAAKAMSASVFAVMSAVFVLAALCGNIALRLRINEINSEINSVKSSIAELDSQKTALEVEMQRKISYANIELEATQLGMRKLEADRVTYIRVNDKNAAKTADGKVVTAEE